MRTERVQKPVSTDCLPPSEDVRIGVGLLQWWVPITSGSGWKRTASFRENGVTNACSLTSTTDPRYRLMDTGAAAKERSSEVLGQMAQ